MDRDSSYHAKQKGEWDMDFGLHVGTRRVGATPDGLQAIAKKTEEMGFSYLGFPDHVVIPSAVNSKYPYNKEGVWPAQDTGTCLEQLMTIAYVAAVTEKIRLLTSVLVLPHRAPILTAKMLATADVLSKGRLTVGVGIGWMAEEIRVLDAMPFSKRAAGAEEYITAFRNLWTDQMPSFHGDLIDFESILFDPKPEQKPHPPIWMGGESKPALDRTGRLADGWYPVIANPRHLLDSPTLYATMLSKVKGLVQRAGRAPSALDTALYAPWYQLGKPVAGRDGARRPFTGHPEQIAEDAQAYKEAGLNHLVIGFESQSLSVSLEHIERFATEVMPLCT